VQCQLGNASDPPKELGGIVMERIIRLPLSAVIGLVSVPFHLPKLPHKRNLSVPVVFAEKRLVIVSRCAKNVDVVFNGSFIITRIRAENSAPADFCVIIVRALVSRRKPFFS
jgi:hypothetical protein